MKTSPKCLPLLLLVLACAVAALLAVFPPAGACMTPAGVCIQGWWSAPVRWLYWPLWAALCAGGMALRRFAGNRLANSRFGAFIPLAWLPALVCLPHGLAPIDRTLAGLVLPFGGAFLAAVCLERFLRPWLKPPFPPPRRSHVVPWIWFAASFVLLFAFWAGVARPQRFKSGDAKQYRVQLENLLERGNLELGDRMETMMDELEIPPDPATRRKWLLDQHVRINTAGQVYSYHSFGFPVLAWPFHALLGAFLGEGVLLAALGALALCGVRAACLAHGAPGVAANTVAALTGFSYMWVYTAMSFLPEMLGFGLVAWAFWAIAAQERPGWRWGAAAVAAVACVYLPVAHIRFAPTAGMLAACFGVEGLFFVGDEPLWRRKVPRLAVFALVCFVGWAALWASHAAMFRGTAAYDYGGIAGRVPMVMWAMFSDRHGMVVMVPAATAFVVAALVALFRRDAVARRAPMALSVVAATLWFCCCTTAALDGACLKGRYFYAVVPVLLPFFAHALVRAGRAGRLWLFFLSFLPVLSLFFLAPFLAGPRLVFAPVAFRGFLNLSLFWEPFPSLLRGSSSVGCVLGSVFAGTLFALSLLACTRRGGRFSRTATAAILAVVAFFCGRAVDRNCTSKRLGAFDVLMDERHFHDFRVLGDGPGDCFSAFSEPSNDPGPLYALTDDPASALDGVCRLQHPADLSVDDWRGRPLRWGKFREKFMALPEATGFVAARATGRVVRGTAHLAFQLSGVSDAPDIVLPEGPFDVVFRVRVFIGKQGANFRLALEDGVGEAIIDSIEYAPSPTGLADLLGGFPPGARLVEWDGRPRTDG